MAPLTMWDEVNTGTNLPGRDQDQRHRRRRLQVPVHGQGRRLGQQELPVPGDQGAAQPGQPHGLPRREAPGRSAPRPARPTTWRSWSAAPRPSSRSKTAKLASARYLDSLPTAGNADGRGFRDVELEREVLTLTQQFGIGAQFGGKYFCHDVRVIRLPAPRRLVPGGHRRVVLGRPPGPRQDHRRGRLPRAARDRPGPVPARGHRGAPQRRRGPHRPQPADGRDPGRAVEVPGQDPADR